jgi:hypothetical protein
LAHLGDMELKGLVRVQVKDIKRFPRRRVILLCTLGNDKFVRKLNMNDTWEGTLTLKVET